MLHAGGFSTQPSCSAQQLVPVAEWLQVVANHSQYAYVFEDALRYRLHAVGCTQTDCRRPAWTGSYLSS